MLQDSAGDIINEELWIVVMKAIFAFGTPEPLHLLESCFCFVKVGEALDP